MLLNTLPNYFNPSDKMSRNVYSMAWHLRDNIRFHSTGTGKKSVLWRYDPELGVYRDDAENQIRAMVSNAMAEFFSSHTINEVVNKIKADCQDDDVVLGGLVDEIVLKNGIYNMQTGEFSSEFNPDGYHITRLSLTYDENAKCPRFEKFLQEVLDNENDRMALTEFFGYCLIKDYRFATYVILLGEGSNGKSVALNVLNALLGKENVTSIPLQQLIKNRFKLARLYGKLANIAGDITSEAIRESGLLKTLTGNDVVTAEFKNKDSFEFRNYAKMLFSANELPKAYDQTDAFHRRARLIDFPFTFTKDGERKADRMLLSKLTTPEELSGIFNLVVTAWRRMNAQGGLTGEKSIEEKRKDYVKRSDPIQWFAQEFMSHDMNAEPISKAELYSWYVKVCHGLKKVPTSDRWFHKVLKRVVPYMDETMLRDEDGKRVRAAVGVKIEFASIREFLNDTLDTLDTSKTPLPESRAIIGREGKIDVSDVSNVTNLKKIWEGSAVFDGILVKGDEFDVLRRCEQKGLCRLQDGEWWFLTAKGRELIGDA